MFAIICQLDYPRCKTTNRWRSIDAHFQNRAGSVSLSLLHIKAAYTSFMNVWIQLPCRLPKEQDQKSLTSRWLSFSGWCRERFSPVFDYKGGQYIRKGQRSTNVNILRLAIGYLNATINRITRIPEPEIGTDGSSQTQQNPRVDGYGSGFGPPRCSGSGFWTGLEPNRTVLAVRTWTAGGLPGPVAITREWWQRRSRRQISPPNTMDIDWRAKQGARDPSRWQAWNSRQWGSADWRACMRQLERT